MSLSALQLLLESIFMNLSTRLVRLDFDFAGNLSLGFLFQVTLQGRRVSCQWRWKFGRMRPQRLLRSWIGFFQCRRDLYMLWAYSGSVIPAWVVILEHNLTLFLLKIFSNSKFGMTEETLDSIILWAGVT